MSNGLAIELFCCSGGMAEGFRRAGVGVRSRLRREAGSLRQLHDPELGASLFGDRRPWVSCAEALAEVPAEDLGRPIRLRWKAASDHRPSSQDAPSRTLTTNPNTDGALLEWPWKTPATTVTTDDRLGPPGHHGKSFLSQPNAVVLSERAAAILQGFPTGWRFIGKAKRHRWSQLGQAMPPPLAEAVARAIVAWERGRAAA